MDHSDNDILLSAYLDGELSAAEQANIEHLLATSAEARQIVDELRALRTSLQELPRHKLGPEFAEQVLKRAELEASTAESEISNLKSETSNTASVAQPSPLPMAHRPRIFNRRGIAWSVVAIAAAVILMVTNRRADHQPARRPLGEESIALRDKEPDAAGAAAESHAARHSLSMAEPKFAAASPVEKQSDGMLELNGAPADGSAKQAANSTIGAMFKSELSAETPAVPLAVDRLDALKSDGSSYSFGITQNATSSLGKEQAGDSMPLGAVAGTKLDQSAVAADRPAASPAAMPAGSAGQAAGITDSSGVTGAEDLYSKLSRAGLSYNGPSYSGDDFVVIQVEVSPEAARSRAFDQLLAKNQITMDEPSAARGLRRQRSESSLDAQIRSKAAEESQLEREADKADVTKSVATDRNATIRDLEAIAGDDRLGIQLNGAKDVDTVLVDAVLVDASPEQIQSALAALQSDRAEFPSVSVNGSAALRDRLLHGAVESKDKSLDEGEKYKEQPEGPKTQLQPESLNKQAASKLAADRPEADVVGGAPQPSPMAGGGARGGRGRAGGGGFGGGGGGASRAGRGAGGGQFGGGAPASGFGGGFGGRAAGPSGGAADGVVGGGGGGSGPTSAVAGSAEVAAQSEQRQRSAGQFGRATRLSLYDKKSVTDEKSKLPELAKDVAQSVDGRKMNDDFGNFDAAATSTRGTAPASAPPVVLGEIHGEGAASGATAASVAPREAQAQKEAAGRDFKRSSEAKDLAEFGDVTKALPATTRRALFVLRVVNPPASSVTAAPEPTKPAAPAPTAVPAQSSPAER